VPNISAGTRKYAPRFDMLDKKEIKELINVELNASKLIGD